MKLPVLLTLICFISSTYLSNYINAQTHPPLEKYIKDQQQEAKKAEEGLYYTIEKNGTGQLPKNGDYILVKFKGKNLDGITFDESGTEPFVFQLGKRQVIRGWDKGISLFSVGTKAKIFLSPDLAYGKTGAGKMVPPNSPVMFDIHIIEILDDKAYDEYMVQLEEKERQRYEKIIQERFEADKIAIHKYCIKHKIKTKRTHSGVSYQVTKKGRGSFPKTGETITIQYKGYLVDGTVFEKNTAKTAFSFPVGKKKAIKGLDEVISFFNKGAEGVIIIPSKLAYGAMPIDEENISIPAHSVLIFELKVLDIQINK